MRTRRDMFHPNFMRVSEIAQIRKKAIIQYYDLSINDWARLQSQKETGFKWVDKIFLLTIFAYNYKISLNS